MTRFVGAVLVGLLLLCYTTPDADAACVGAVTLVTVCHKTLNVACIGKM
jgi:hypothetical protein